MAGILAGTANSWTRLKQLDLSSSSPLTENIRYQQNLTGRRIAIVVLGKGRWRLIKARLPEIAEAVNAATPGSFIEVEILLD